MLRLKYERQRRGWSLQELGFHAGVQGADISKIERGLLRPYPSQAQRLAKVLGLTPDGLLEEVGDPDDAKKPVHAG